MPHPNLIIAGACSIAILALFIAICVVHWANWKRKKALKDEALRKEVQAHKWVEDETGGKHIFAPYIPQIKMTKQVSNLLKDTETACPRCGDVGPLCPC
jgi:cbb3-type cytochrome oxidase subunit 3